MRQVLEGGTIGGYTVVLTGPVPLVRASAARRARVLRRQAGFAGRLARRESRREVAIGFIDGSIAEGHPSLASARILVVDEAAARPLLAPTATEHATFTASMLVGQGEGVLGLCPDALLLSLPAVSAPMLSGAMLPGEVAERLAEAVRAAVRAGADVLHMGLEFDAMPTRHAAPLTEALREAVGRGVRAVLAAGNSGLPAASSVLAADGAVPVALGGRAGDPHPLSTWGLTIGRRGLTAPGVDVPGAVPPDGYALRSGSSFAAAFVTAGFALLRAAGHDPDAAWAALLDSGGRGATLFPPPLDAEAADARLFTSQRRAHEYAGHRAATGHRAAAGPRGRG